MRLVCWRVVYARYRVAPQIFRCLLRFVVWFCLKSLIYCNSVFDICWSHVCRSLYFHQVSMYSLLWQSARYLLKPYLSVLVLPSVYMYSLPSLCCQNVCKTFLFALLTFLGLLYFLKEAFCVRWRQVCKVKAFVRPYKLNRERNFAFGGVAYCRGFVYRDFVILYRNRCTY